jgi:iron complex transport system ATP-binding protein
VNRGLPVANVDAALRRITEFGDYFAVVPGPPGPDVQRYCISLASLYAGEDPLERLLEVYLHRLGTDERRVAASILFQGFAARIASPMLAGLTQELVLELEPRHCWVRYRPGGAMPIFAGTRHARAVDLDTQVGVEHASDLLHASLVEAHLIPMSEALARSARLAAPIAWGNAAVSITTAARLLGPRAPHRADAIASVVRELLARAPLAGGGRLQTGLRLRRRSCCLFYRSAGGGLCGDCPLPRVARRGGGPRVGADRSQC